VIQLDIRRIVVSGIAAGFVILVISTLISAATQALFNYNVLNLAGMRSVNDPISILFFLHPFVVALGLAILYDFARKSFTRSAMRNGIALGLLGWIVYGISSAFIVFSSMSYPIGFTVNSVVGSLIYMVCAGITITRLSK
jgi:hypothetical protein